MAKSVKFSSLNLDVTLFFNYAPFLLLGLVFLRIVGMLCVGFRFHFARVFGISCQAAPSAVGLKQPLQYAFLPPFDHPIV
jgi:hypothetical protein